MKHLTLLSILFIVVLGCAVLNQPTIEIPFTKLSSITNPKMVDGNLNTVSTFIATGHVEKNIRMFEVHLVDLFKVKEDTQQM